MKKGFSLMELLIVIIIISLLMAISAPLFVYINRSNAVRSSFSIVSSAIQDARMMAVKTKVKHFVRFDNNPNDVSPQFGQVSVFKDNNSDNYPGTNEEVWKEPKKLPIYVYFSKKPAFVILEPTGFLSYSPGYSDTASSLITQNAPNQGDLIIKSKADNFILTIDILPSCAKVRKSFLHYQ